MLCYGVYYAGRCYWHRATTRVTVSGCNSPIIVQLRQLYPIVYYVDNIDYTNRGGITMIVEGLPGFLDKVGDYI